ncbi:MAG: N-6 DNA methylase [Defluviitaleaceae bacterium]|nr:N-6 DNA methylase [Defluviitaleaceae bacterium]
MFTNEADVETKYIYDILLKKVLNIPSNQIIFRHKVNIIFGREKKLKEVDILVKDDKDENIFIIEAKSPLENLSSYFNQLDSYAFALELPFAIITNGLRLVLRVYLSGNKKEILLDDTIENLEKTEYKILKKMVLELIDKRKYISTKIKEDSFIKYSEKEKLSYRRLFQTIHTLIRSMDKLDPGSSFDEFSKALFVKLINDNLNYEDGMQVKKIKELGSVQLQKTLINQWFKDKIKYIYKGIFNEDETIKLQPSTLIKILEILDKEFILNDMEIDLKGRVFEEFLPRQLRGKGLGQFFTPRNIVNFMVELADIGFSDRVLDFAAGSGGFLIKSFEIKKETINKLPKIVFETLGKSKEELIKEAKKQIFGIDAENRAVRTAKMNMILWGDGEQIYHGNGLDTKSNNGDTYSFLEYDKDINNSGVDVILANPPFGSIEENQDILKKYLLPIKKRLDDGTIYFSSEKTEHLFIEKAYKTLKPEGKLLIVLPEGIFSNKSSKVRDFILSHFQIQTIVKLPKHTFVMSGVDTINTVILYAIKNSINRQNHIIFNDKSTWINTNNNLTINFVSVNNIGYEPSGAEISDSSKNDLDILLKKLNDNDLNTLLAEPIEFSKLEYGDDVKNQTWKKNMLKFMQITFSDIPERLDPTYHFFMEETKDILNKYINIPSLVIKKEKLDKDKLLNNLENEYKYVSVTKNIKGIIDSLEDRTVDDIISMKKSSLPQKLEYNDLVFNPYRINTGSIIRINLNNDNLITSPAYIRFKSEEYLSKYLVLLLKTPFMRYQINVLASGSVRDNFGEEQLKKLKVPVISKSEQEKIILELDSYLNKIEYSFNCINDNIDKMNNVLKNN